MNSFIFYNSSLEKNFQRLKSKEVMLKIKVAGLPSLTQLYNDLYPYAQKKQTGAVTPSNYSLGNIGHWCKFHLNNAMGNVVCKKIPCGLKGLTNVKVEYVNSCHILMQ